MSVSSVSNEVPVVLQDPPAEARNEATAQTEAVAQAALPPEYPTCCPPREWKPVMGTAIKNPSLPHILADATTQVVSALFKTMSSFVSDHKALIIQATKLGVGVVLVTSLAGVLPGLVSTVSDLALSVLATNCLLALNVAKLSLCAIGALVGIGLVMSHIQESPPKYEYTAPAYHYYY